MKGNRGTDTRPERKIRSALFKRGLRFRKHARPLPGLRCRADIVFPTERVAVFIDGCFWHGCPSHGRTPTRNSRYWEEKLERNRSRDDRNTALLEASGWLVLRYWEHEQTEAAVSEIRESVLGRRAAA